MSLHQRFFTILFLLISLISGKTQIDSLDIDSCYSDPQYEALMALYNSTEGENWTFNDGWGTDCDYCTWFGLQCDNEGKVVQLFLPENNLQGQIPEEISGLTSLQLLLLDRNFISGSLPSSLYQLSNLQFLLLHDNQISGSISNDIGNLERLQWALLHNNRFSGNLPDSLGNLRRLLQVSLSNNQFSGELPSAYGQLTQIFSLNLESNLLEGCIPEEFTFLCGRSVQLGGNACLSHGADFRSFCLSDSCYVEMAMDPDCSDCDESEEYQALMEFYDSTGGNEWLINEGWGASCDYCEWYGVLCDTLDNITGLLLPENNLVGDIPENIIQLENLEFLLLDNNRLTSLPSNIGELQNLQFFTAVSNELEGNIPASLGNCDTLSWLMLNDNKLSGEIPQSIFQLKNIDQLILSSNKLSGSIPENIGELSALASLYLNDNQLEGCIPSSFQSLCQTDVDLSNNTCLSHNSDFEEFCRNAECTLPRIVGCGTCDDGIWNQDEEYIDCGGSCERACHECERIEDYFTLMEIYDSLDGDNWTNNGNWGDTCDICTWYGVDCDTTGRVSSLILSDNGLNGTLPSTIGKLSEMTVLILDFNSIRGELPSEIGQLSNLEFLLLGDNELTGEIPRQVGLLTRLQWLLLNNNNLTGSIPGELNWLDRATQILLSNNQLSGEIHTDLGFLRRVQSFHLNNNNLTGCIPESFKNYCGLDISLRANECLSHNGEINIFCESDSCYFTSDECNTCDDGIQNYDEEGIDCGGYCQPCQDCSDTPDYVALMTIYDSLGGSDWINNEGWGENCEICKWFGVECDSLNRVTGLFLPFNGLKGAFPEAILDLEYLESLLMDFNQIEGEIPLEIDRLQRMRLLVLSSNAMTGIIPESISNLTSLEWLLLNQNDFYGEIPASIGDLRNLNRLVLSENTFTGEIPSTIAQLDLLRYLILNSNDLSGCIPQDFQKFCGINVNMEDNPCLSHGADFIAFCGSPSCDELELCDCYAPSKERDILIDIYNYQGGSVWINNEGWLQECDVCDWHGITCDQYGYVSELDLSNNGLQGELSDKFNNLIHLSKLNLSNNNLVGSMSESISQLEYLSSLDLSNNSIGGFIPKGLYELAEIEEMDLSHNRITDSLSSALAALVRVDTLDLSYNSLMGEIPEELAQLEFLSHLNLSNNELEGCIPETFNILCGLDIDLSVNECLSHQGDITLFCEGSTCDLSNTGCQQEEEPEEDGGRRVDNEIKSVTKARENLAFDHLNINPNPASEYILIQDLSEMQYDRISITNISGQIVWQQSKYHQSDNRINIDHLRPGLYNVTLESSESLTQGKFIKI